MKRIRILLYLGVICLQFISPLVILTSSGSAPQDNTVLTPQVNYVFDENIEFSASVISDKVILRAVIFLRVDGESQTDILDGSIEQGQTSSVIAIRNLQEDPLASFSRLTYWWHLDFEDGSSFDSAPYSFQYYDNRLVWNYSSEQISNTSFQVFWKSPLSGIDRTAINTATDILPILESQIARPAPDNISVFIYQQTDELPSSYTPASSQLFAGKAIPEFSTILLVIPDSDEAGLLLEKLLPHELVHLMLYRRLGASYDNLPNWLAEGYAVLQEKTPDPELRLALEQAAADDTILSIGSLCGTFPSQGEAAILAYAESAAFVQYLLDIYGTGSFSALLDAYHDGATCEGGVNRVFQRDLDSMESEWLASISQDHASMFSNLSPWALLAAPLVLLLVYSLLLKRKAE